ncbi:hypothetical protein ACFYU8_18050 [Brevibacillus sp. NPDC003359]|uniref:hypothetical protein n=1 Tax=unclassified Brevibacillus TaxID=2684853 RepID=UPI0036BDA9A5
MYKSFRVKLSSCNHCGADYQNSGNSYRCDEAYLDKPTICGNCQIGKLYVTNIVSEICVLCGKMVEINDERKNKCPECEAKFESATTKSR